MIAAATGDGNERAGCNMCRDTGWLARGYYVCDCRAGDYAWAAWEGMTIAEYDERARGTSDYHGSNPNLAVVRESDT